MKEYDRAKRKWVGVDDKSAKKKKDPKVCIGKKPHDFVLVLPHLFTYDETYKFNPEEVYAILDEQQDFFAEQRKRLAKLGVHFPGRYGNSSRKETRIFRCARCMKYEYVYPTDKK